MEAVCAPAAFAITGKELLPRVPPGPYMNFEIGSLGCFRLTTDGTKNVVMAPFTKLSQHIAVLTAKKGEPPLFNVSSLAVKTWLATVSKEQLEKAAQALQLRCATISKGDLMWHPVGWLIAERVHGKDTVKGVRVGKLLVDRNATKELQAAQSDMRASGKFNPLLDAAIKLFAPAPQPAAIANGLAAAAPGTGPDEEETAKLEKLIAEAAIATEKMKAKRALAAAAVAMAVAETAGHDGGCEAAEKAADAAEVAASGKPPAGIEDSPEEEGAARAATEVANALESVEVTARVDPHLSAGAEDDKSDVDLATGTAANELHAAASEAEERDVDDSEKEAESTIEKAQESQAQEDPPPAESTIGKTPEDPAENVTGKRQADLPAESAPGKKQRTSTARPTQPKSSGSSKR